MLSLLALVVIVAMLGFAFLGAQLIAVKPAGQPHQIAAKPFRPSRTESAGNEARAPWPRFLTASKVQSGSYVVNGVNCITEEWQTWSSESEVIEYYREQMLARGWRDVTAEEFGITPELEDQFVNKGAADNVREREFFDKTMASNLVLNRGNWTMHVDAASAPSKLSQTSVRIFAAATSSIKNLATELTASLVSSPNSLAKNQKFEVDNSFGGEHYRTTISERDREPSQAFQEALTDLKTKNWRLLYAPRLDRKENPAGLQAWLVNEGGYAMLSVKASSKALGSSVVLTEVTP
jgi:hypothetical protein